MLSYAAFIEPEPCVTARAQLWPKTDPKSTKTQIKILASLPESHSANMLHIVFGLEDSVHRTMTFPPTRQQKRQSAIGNPRLYKIGLDGSLDAVP